MVKRVVIPLVIFANTFSRLQKCYYLYDTKQTEKGRENGQYGRCPLTVAGFMINCILYVCVIVDLRKVSNFSAISWGSGHGIWHNIIYAWVVYVLDVESFCTL